MSWQPDDERLQVFLEEAREHLADVESDLLRIEQAGSRSPPELLNKVFRAVHSVKGGAGFFALKNTQELAHAMETVMGRIRGGELLPAPEIISVLLESADCLKRMVPDPAAFESRDISAYLTRLNAILDPVSPETGPEDPGSPVAVRLPDGRCVFNPPQSRLREALRAEQGGENLYVLELDVMQDIQRRGKTPAQVLRELGELTAVVDHRIDTHRVGTLERFSGELSLSLQVLLASGMDPGMFQELLGLEARCVHPAVLSEDAPDREAAVPDGRPAEPRRPIPAPGSAAPAAANPPVPAGPEEGGPPGQGASASGTDGTVRVRVRLLDRLMTLAGELVLARNELLLSAAAGSSRSMERVSQRVGHVTSELQDAIMSTRMQSIGLLFGRFPRIVRDLAREQGKRVELACRGEEVELDKTIIETIADPLTHLVRNAVSHGIETPAARRAAGKPPAGSLQMNAVHNAGQVVIEVRDDGAGVDPVRVRGKALEAGIHTAAQLNEMSKKEVIRLLFRPGFSTAEQVDSLSGRGVGLDVVHANITRLGGVVDLESEPGRGAAVRITLPLTLAIIPGLLVSAEGETFCIPQANLVELVRVPAREVKRRMERIGEAAVLRLRGQLLPLVRLRDVLGIRPPTWAKPPRGERLPDIRDRITDRRWEPPPEEPVPPADRVPDHRDGQDRRASPVGAVNVAVLSAGDFRFGLIVESLLDSSDIVVKPLGRHTADAGVYSGATILGDGRVSLILDIAGIGRQIRTAGLSEVEREQERRQRQRQPAPASQRRTVLVLWDREESPFALPLEHVRRIEKVAGARIQRRAGGTYMEYRNGSLPLCSLACASGEPPQEEDAHGHVVVFRAGRREAGLLAAQVEDILEVEGQPERLVRPRPGIAGSWILRERMTLLLDPEGLLSLLAPEEAAAPPRAPRPAEPTGRRVLVVEDSAFFLGEIRDILQGAGHGVLTARGGLEALEVLEANGDTIDLVVTDIEMPDLDGFGLTERIRANDRFRDLPVIAVTTVMGKEAEDRGRAVGIDEYMIKLDRERIVERSGHFLEHGRAS